ncbi:THO complex subunit 7 homolog isoform X2 [Ornithorhynchus anatinus]|uniref:THO complex subunit 7 homolog isoform X2 n=1 Tax=Ornithorhynchus anatinus TaxID=9258 RepID=UPI0010A7B81F|nr:THO complex subunit 7 homolog isoform X2 [Ornithorhynchus anatinus]
MAVYPAALWEFVDLPTPPPVTVASQRAASHRPAHAAAGSAVSAMGAVTDDEVIRKRLLIDGDGAGDDRRINLLVKSFIKWCNAGSQEEGYSQYQRMLSTLSQCEFSMGKTLLVYDMNLREMENYEKIYKDIENNIAGAHEKIAECKKQILQAKRIRKNRQEYDALAKVIQYHPDRHETLKELDALGKELQHLSHIKESVEDKMMKNSLKLKNLKKAALKLKLSNKQYESFLILLTCFHLNRAGSGDS